MERSLYLCAPHTASMGVCFVVQGLERYLSFEGCSLLQGPSIYHPNHPVDMSTRAPSRGTGVVPVCHNQNPQFQGTAVAVVSISIMHASSILVSLEMLGTLAVKRCLL